MALAVPPSASIHLELNFKQQLQEFIWKIPTDCRHIKKSVSNTITLMQALPTIETLDLLAKHLEEEYAAQKRTEEQTDKPILDAKIATSAMLLGFH